MWPPKTPLQQCIPQYPRTTPSQTLSRYSSVPMVATSRGNRHLHCVKCKEMGVTVGPWKVIDLMLALGGGIGSECVMVFLHGELPLERVLLSPSSIIKVFPLFFASSDFRDGRVGGCTGCRQGAMDGGHKFEKEPHRSDRELTELVSLCIW